MDDLVDLLPSLLLVHLSEVSLLQQLDSVLELSEDQEVLGEDINGRAEGRNNNVLLHANLKVCEAELAVAQDLLICGFTWSGVLP